MKLTYRQALHDALTEALEKSTRDISYVPTYTVTQACYCLARIGGPNAEKALREIVKRLGGRTEIDDGRWPLVACCSYGECAGTRAVPDAGPQMYQGSAFTRTAPPGREPVYILSREYGDRR